MAWSRIVSSMEISHHRWQQDLGATSGRAFLRLTLLGISLLSISLRVPSAHAEQPPGTNAPSQTFAVALPELDGPVTMGIFSSKGDLVRLLYRDAPVDSIPAGLNGLIMTWDGKNGSGQAAPAGTYKARGLVHGAVSVSTMPFRDKNWLLPVVSSGPSGPLGDTNAEPASKDSGGGVCTNRIMIPAAKDELLSSQPMIAIVATPLDKFVQISAGGLPLVEVPIAQNTAPVSATLSPGLDPGTAVITIGTGKESTSCTISGLDHLVPLEAGTLEIPPDAFHPAPLGKESRR